VVDNAEIKPTKKGNGTYIQITFQVVEGQYKNRKLWSRINYTNPNTEAQRIGRAELSAFCRAIGIMTPKDTGEFHGRPVVITVGHEKREDTNELANVIKKYAPAGNVQGAITNGSSKPAATPAAAANAAPPWAAAK
jgi:hypothetical protein